MEGKEIIQHISYKPTGDEYATKVEIPAETKEEAILIIKERLYEKGFKDLEDKIERGYKFDVIDTYHKEKNQYLYMKTDNYE